jgi:hypothetical protein
MFAILKKLTMKILNKTKNHRKLKINKKEFLLILRLPYLILINIIMIKRLILILNFLLKQILLIKFCKNLNLKNIFLEDRLEEF